MRQKRRSELERENKRNSRTEQEKKSSLRKKQTYGGYNADYNFTEEFLQSTQVRRKAQDISR
ncbi:MAG: hypothetical protein K5780_00665, partial [Alphaproteobacteria bacterium]|nr:hypothetical protein [Alphaproteobacteria bacterium]